MLLRRTAALLVAALTLASCDNPAGPDPDPSGSAVPAKLDVVAGGDQRDTVGQELPQPLVVRVLDARGRPVRDAIVNFRVISGGGSVFAGAALTNADGEARERWTLGTVARDTQRVEARVLDAAGQALVSGAFAAVGVADAPANIAPVGPAALAASPGAAVPVAVRVEDRFGNRVAGTAVAWQAPEGEGSVTPTQGVTDSTGVAAAQWTLAYSVGAHTLAAFAGTSLSTQFTAASETPDGSRLSPASGDQQVAAAGSALAQPLVVQLLNAAGQPIRNAAVAWSVTAGSITPGSAVTDAQGRVSATWNPGTTAGPRTATASAAGAASAVFTAQVRAGAAAELQKVSGDGQTAFTGGELAEGVRVAVVDAYGNPVAGHEVRWRIVSGGGSVSPAAALTGVDGRTETRWTLGATAGQQALAAESGALGVQFLATATPTPPPPPPPAPVVTIVSPADSSKVGDTFRITAKAMSVEALSSVTATVADRSFPLAFADGEWSGTVDVTGLFGPRKLTVTAVSASGLVGTASATYVHDAPPPPPPAAVQIVSPADGSLVPTRFVLSATVTSTEAVTGVTASVAGRSFPLTLSSGKWSGTVSFEGLAGSHVLTVTASAASGVVGTASATYTRDVPPAVQVESPVSFQVATPTIRVKATCTDDAAGGCASLVVRVAGSTAALAQGTGSVDATVSLAAYDGLEISLELVARDSNGQTTTVTRSVYVEASSAWTSPEHGPGPLLDADAGRLLAHNSGRVMVKTRSTGAVQTIFEQAGAEYPFGFLTPRGAIFSESRRWIHDWRDGTLVTISAHTTSSLEVAGSWALWHHNNTHLIRRDLEAGTNVVVSTQAGEVHNDVAANGDVVFYGTGDVFRYRAGTTTQLNSPADPLASSNPVTDGTNVLFLKQVGSNFRLVMIGPGGGEVVLTEAGVRGRYAAVNGWVAFTAVGPTGAGQVWRRAPDGTLAQVNPAGTDAFLRSLGPNGDVVYVVGEGTMNQKGDRYVVKPGGSPKAIGRDWGRALWIDGVLHNILGATLFRINY